VSLSGGVNLLNSLVTQAKNSTFPCLFDLTAFCKMQAQLLASFLSSSGRKLGTRLVLGVFVGIFDFDGRQDCFE
jgi:hypothetical protein